MRSLRSALLRGSFLLVMVLGGTWAAGWIPHLRFVGEDIRVRLGPDFYVVDDTYTYANPWPLLMEQGLDVPFPEGVAPPAVVEAWSGEDPVPVRWIGGRPRLLVRAPPWGKVTVRLRFRHAAPDRRGTYLLRSTRRWGRPVRDARFTLEPEGARVTSDSLGQGGSETTRIQALWPREDWHFTWEIP